jgi:hypothetical protein
MDTDLSTFHAPEAAAEVVDEGCRRVYERGWIDIARSRPVSTRTTSAWQFVEGPPLRATDDRHDVGGRRLELDLLSDF